MKKISLLVVLLLAFSLVFAACSQTVTTERVVRWEANEQHVFNISKVNWEAPSVTVGDETFAKNPRSSYESINASKDQWQPADVGGTYTITITTQNNDAQCLFSTKQVLFLQYETSRLTSLDIWAGSGATELENATGLADFVVAQDDESCPIEHKEGYTILRSETTSTVLFQNNATQKPISSANLCHGFYLGDRAQQITHYNYSTSYNWDEGKIVVSHNGEETTHNVSKNASLIDSNQLLLYLRSLEKTSDKLQDGPSVQMFSAVNGTVYTASFGYFTYSCNTLLVGPEGTDLPVKLNFVCVVVNGSVYMSQLNLPDTINKDASLDSINRQEGDPINKYTTVRFRVGTYNYEVQALDSALLNALVVKEEAQA